MSLYFIQRGPRPGYHRAPWHERIVCDRKAVAKWEAGDTGDGCDMWVSGTRDGRGNWLLVRWRGLDIDHGHVASYFKLPDGTNTRDLRQPSLVGATWWSDRKMPNEIATSGVAYPSDDWTQQRILDVIAQECHGAMVTGIARRIPEWWPGPGPTAEAVAQGAGMESLQRGIQGVIDSVRVERLRP